MDDLSIFKLAAENGVAVLLAAVMFGFYRKDVQALTSLWKTQTEMLVMVVKDNTESNMRLVLTVDALHRRLDAELGAEGNTSGSPRSAR